MYNMEKLENRLFLFTLLFVTLVFVYMMKPFLHVVFWASIIGVLFYPIFLKLQGYKINASLAALITIIVCLSLLILPLVYIVIEVVKEGALLYQYISNGKISILPYIDVIVKKVPAIKDVLAFFDITLESIKATLMDGVMAASGLIAHNAVALGERTIGLVTDLCLTLYIAFFFLRDGSTIMRKIIIALPLGDHRERRLFGKFAEVTRATVKGTLLVAMAQGALGGLIFAFLNIHAAILWGVVMTLFSLVPVVGAAVIWAPVAGYLLLIGNYQDAFILIGFGVFVVGLVDNILRPILVGNDTKLPDFIVLLSTLAGFMLFGVNGFVTGPLAAVLFITFWNIFTEEFYGYDPETGELLPSKMSEDQ